MSDITLNVKGCKRCAGQHDKLSFRPLARAEGGWTHHAVCPANGEPLMLKIDASDQLRLQPMSLRAPDDLDDIEAVLKLPAASADERVAMALEIIGAKRKIPEAGVAPAASR